MKCALTAVFQVSTPAPLPNTIRSSNEVSLVETTFRAHVTTRFFPALVLLLISLFSSLQIPQLGGSFRVCAVYRDAVLCFFGGTENPQVALVKFDDEYDEEYDEEHDEEHDEKHDDGESSNVEDGSRHFNMLPCPRTPCLCPVSGRLSLIFFVTSFQGWFGLNKSHLYRQPPQSMTTVSSPPRRRPSGFSPQVCFGGLVSIVHFYPFPLHRLAPQSLAAAARGQRWGW